MDTPRPDNSPAPHVTFIIGGPGSGKTEDIVNRVAEGYAGGNFWDALVLVPTVRHGDQLRRRLVAKCGVAMGLRVERLSQFSHRLAAARGLSIMTPAVADELLSRITRSEVETGGAAYFQPILGAKGLNRLVRTAILNLMSEGVAAGDFRSASSATDNPSLQALAAIYTAYAADLNRRGWVHPSAESFVAAEVAAESKNLPRLVVVDGFQMLRGGELALLKSVADSTPLVVSIDAESGARAHYDFRRLRRAFPTAETIRFGPPEGRAAPWVFGGESADQEDQLRDIARLIKHRLLEDPELRPSDFAIGFRRVVPHLALARQIFAEYQLPLEPAAADSLGEQPLGAWLRRLLHLSSNGWRLTDFVAVMDGAFIDLGRWNLTRDDVQSFARRARSRNLWRGHPDLLRVGDSLDDARVQQGMAHALQRLQELLEGQGGSMGERALRWDEALFGDAPLLDKECLKRKDVEGGVKLLRQHLQELTRVQQALGGGDVPFEAFAGWLLAQMETPQLLTREVGGVVVGPIRMFNGLRFNSVFIGGLVEGEFPAPKVFTSLLNESALESLAQAGLQLPPEPTLSEDELWRSATARADARLYLWKTRLDDRGRPASGSYYYDLLQPEPLHPPKPAPQEASSQRELAIACAREWRRGGLLRPEGHEAWRVVKVAAWVEQLRRSYQNAGKFEGAIDAELVPYLTAPEVAWSASRMETYRTCSFQFFGKYGLGLKELDEELLDADAAIRGSVIHEILERTLKPLRDSKRALTPDTLDEALANLAQHGPEIWNRAPAKWGFVANQTWALRWDDELARLAWMLAAEAEMSRELGVNRILGTEMSMETELPLEPPMKVIGDIDRLDVGFVGLVVVDYKSGREIKKKKVVEGEKLQLQLYALMASSDQGVSDVVARYAWLNPHIKPWRLSTFDMVDSQIIDEIIPLASNVRQSVEAGNFQVYPQQQPCPRYCAYQHICRVNEFSRWKWR